MKRGSVCGIDVAAVSPTEAARLIVDAAMNRTSLDVHLCNAYTLSLVDRDPRLLAALTSSDLNLPDGTPVGWFLRGHGVRQPVRGPSLVREVMREGIDAGLAHYLWGGAPGVAEQMAQALNAMDPRIQVAGWESPPYSELDDIEVKQLASRVTEAGADMLWIGIGTPRQDYVTSRLAEHLSLPVVPVGAAFDFISGRIPEAPSLLHGSGLEWVHRLVREPGRLWRRYLFGNVRFLATAARYRLRPTSSRSPD